MQAAQTGPVDRLGIGELGTAARSGIRPSVSSTSTSRRIAGGIVCVARGFEASPRSLHGDGFDEPARCRVVNGERQFGVGSDAKWVTSTVAENPPNPVHVRHEP
jgi:hypothetical protein